MGVELIGKSYQHLEDLAHKKDVSGRVSFNSVFGEGIIGTRIPSIAGQFMYGADTRKIVDLSANGGSISTNDALLVISSGTAANGDGLIESKQSLRYIAGHEAYAFFTTVFSKPKTNSKLQAGLYEENNGFYIGFDGLEFGFMRLRAGVEHWISIDDFDTDIKSGNNEYGYKFDYSKGNIWKISYGYLGFANITLEVLCTCGNWLRVHTIDYPNTSPETHIANTYLPLRARALNDGNTSDVSVKIGSVSAGIVDGGNSKVTDRRFGASVPAKATSTDTIVVAFRNKSTFNSITNRIPALLERVALSTDGAQNVTIELWKGATLTGAETWTDADVNSTLEYSTDAVLSVAGTEFLIAFELSKSQDYVEKVGDFNFLLFPNETAIFLANGNNTVKQSINWTENF